MQGLGRDEVLAAYDAFVLPQGAARRKLSVHLVAAQTENAPRASSALVSEEAEAGFKAGLVCSAAALPVARARHEAIRAPRRLVDLVNAATWGYRRTQRSTPQWLGRQPDPDVDRMGRGRGILDYVASLTDDQAVALAGRLRGGTGLLWGGGLL